jgi:hypothetical protein
MEGSFTRGGVQVIAEFRTFDTLLGQPAEFFFHPRLAPLLSSLHFVAGPNNNFPPGNAEVQFTTNIYLSGNEKKVAITWFSMTSAMEMD